MRDNPAFQAITELAESNKLPTKSCLKHDSKGVPYYLIELANTKAFLIIHDIKYYALQKPHLSVYKTYKSSQTQCLSTFHYTWFGYTTQTIDEEVTSREIVLHVYFNQAGIYLYHKINKLNGGKLHANALPPEERIIRQYAKMSITKILQTILNYIDEKFNQADAKVDLHLEKLETVSTNINKRIKDYTRLAHECIRLINIKNRWIFNSKDYRGRLLLRIIKAVTLSIYNHEIAQPTKTLHGKHSQ